MALATITTKGQLTIPKTIRESLQLHSGDKVEIIVTDTKEAIMRPISKKVDDLFCKLHKPGRKPVTIEEIDEVVTKKMKEKFA